MTQQVDKTFDIGEDINLGIVNNVKRIMENMITKLQKKNSEDLNTVIQHVKAEITQVTTKVDKVQEEIT
jgi:CO dehydrogenase/acetyl-CoA synthase alpha subunit